MSSIINLFRNGLTSKDSGGIAHSPSFSDFSLGAAAEVEESFKDTPRSSLEENHAAGGTGSASSTPKVAVSPQSHAGQGVWQKVFHPGSNPNNKMVGKDYYDNADKNEPSVWDEVVKAERTKVFRSFDHDQDGFISASDLRKKLGEAADVQQLIAAADKNGDGRIDYYEFQELLRNS